MVERSETSGDRRGKRASASTSDTLAKAASPQEWNLLLLSSPEFMVR